LISHSEPEYSSVRFNEVFMRKYRVDMGNTKVGNLYRWWPSSHSACGSGLFGLWLTNP
jgi:hypothetical protein